MAPHGRRWQEWLTEPGTVGYAEIQAGLARTQLEHVPLEPGAEFSWLESYGPLSADPLAVHGEDWAAARAETEQRLAEALPRADVEAAHAAWHPFADTEPGESLATGSGWGALEVRRGKYELPGTPFADSTLGEQQQPWLELLDQGAFPEPRRAVPPGPSMVSPHWRDMLETAPAEPLTEYHLGIAQWHAGDRAQAVRSWERGLVLAPSRWPLLRCLAVAAEEAGSGTGPRISTARRSTTCARSAATRARPGRRPRRRWAGRRFRRCWRPGAPRRPGPYGPPCLRRSGSVAGSVCWRPGC